MGVKTWRSFGMPILANWFEHLAGHRWAVGAAAFSPDDRQLVTGSGDIRLSYGTVAMGECSRHSRGTNVVRAVAYFPDGKNIVSGGYDGLVKIWTSRAGNSSNA